MYFFLLKPVDSDVGCLSVIYSVFSPLKVASQDDKISNDVNDVITHNLVCDIAVAAFVVIMLSAEEWIIVV